LLLGGCKGEEVRRNPVKVTHVNAFELFVSKKDQLKFDVLLLESWHSLLKVKIAESAEGLFLGLPHAVNNILNVQDKVGLAVSSIAERHVRRIGLRNGSQSQMRGPRLDHDHVACNETCGICAAARIGFAVENNWTIAVGWVTKNFVEENSEAVQVTDVEWAEISMESIVQKSVINSEVHR
jgi:hypothetical protein